MTERPLMSADELKSIPKGHFIVMKTGIHPTRTRLRLFLEWGISFEEPYTVPKRENAVIRYAGRAELVEAIQAKFPPKQRENARRNDKKPIEGKPESDAPHVKT